MEKFVVSVALAAFGPDPRAGVRRARAAGAQGVLIPARGAVDVTTQSTTGLAELRRVVTGSGMALVGLQHDLPREGLSVGKNVDRSIDELGQVFAAAAEMGRAMVCVDVGALPTCAAPPVAKPVVTPEMAGLLILPETPSPAPVETPPQQSAADREAEARVDSALSEIGTRADRYGVIVAMRSQLSTIASLDRAIARAGCPWFGVDLDPVSILADEWSRDEILSRLGKHLHHVRGRDAARGFGKQVQPVLLGEGKADWRTLATSLEQSGYHGPITVDPQGLPDPALASELGIGTLKKLLAA